MTHVLKYHILLLTCVLFTSNVLGLSVCLYTYLYFWRSMFISGNLHMQCRLLLSSSKLSKVAIFSSEKESLAVIDQVVQLCRPTSWYQDDVPFNACIQVILYRNLLTKEHSGKQQDGEVRNRITYRSVFVLAQLDVLPFTILLRMAKY